MQPVVSVLYKTDVSPPTQMVKMAACSFFPSTSFAEVRQKKKGRQKTHKSGLRYNTASTIRLYSQVVYTDRTKYLLLFCFLCTVLMQQTSHLLISDGVREQKNSIGENDLLSILTAGKIPIITSLDLTHFKSGR